MIIYSNGPAEIEVNKQVSTSSLHIYAAVRPVTDGLVVDRKLGLPNLQSCNDRFAALHTISYKLHNLKK